MTFAPPNPWITNALLDSCAFDPKEATEAVAAEALLRLHMDQNLPLEFAWSVGAEIEHPNTPAIVKHLAQSMIVDLATNLSADERDILSRIHARLTGNGRPEKMEADARHVFEAQKYGSYFVTTDERILKHSQHFAADYGLAVVRPSEYFARVTAEANPHATVS